MRIYVVHKTDECGVSAGFKYFSSKREAEQDVRAYLRDNPDEQANVNPIDICTDKAGILHALNTLANHPDNG